MKKVICLSSMKFRCLMLLACLILLVGVTSCSSDEFETNLPEEPKQLSKAELLQKYSKAELIEQALSRMPKTRANNNRFEMVTIKDSVCIQLSTTETIWIQWTDEEGVAVTAGSNVEKKYKFTDGYSSHCIYIEGTKEAIQSLTIDNNELISLKIYSNENLVILSCVNNHLDELDLPNECQALQVLHVSNNELSALEVTHIPLLYHLYAENNQLTYLDVSGNSNLFQLMLGNNKITAIKLSVNLSALNLSGNPIENIDLSNNPNLINIDVSFTSITNLDLRNNPNLLLVSLEGLLLDTINDHPICDTSFSMFPKLFILNVASTPFTLLDLSKNTMLYAVDISGSAITKLDISDIRVQKLYATRSKLTNLIWGEDGLDNLFEVRIERTPFEKDWDRLEPFISALPRRSETSPGHLYTYSPNMKEITDRLKPRNWLINR